MESEKSGEPERSDCIIDPLGSDCALFREVVTTSVRHPVKVTCETLQIFRSPGLSAGHGVAMRRGSTGPGRRPCGRGAWRGLEHA